MPLVLLGMVLPVAYVGMLGPAVWLTHTSGPLAGLGHGIRPVLEVVYAPLEALRSTPLGPPLQAWVDLWH